MINRVMTVYEKALHKYSTNEFKDLIIAAKKKYFELTGKVHEEDDDYESRMAMFNEWYLFHYIPDVETRSLIKKYLEENNLFEDDIAIPLLNINYSLFELKNFDDGQKGYCYDILHKKKINLISEHTEMGLIKNDLFIGRAIETSGQHIFLHGVTVLPKEIKSLLVKQCDKVSKQNNIYLEYEFLLKLEYYKTKWKNYGHLNTKKIFLFED